MSAEVAIAIRSRRICLYVHFVLAMKTKTLVSVSGFLEVLV